MHKIVPLRQLRPPKTAGPGAAAPLAPLNAALKQWTKNCTIYFFAITVKLVCIQTIISTNINKFETKWHQNHQSLLKYSVLWNAACVSVGCLLLLRLASRDSSVVVYAWCTMHTLVLIHTFLANNTKWSTSSHFLNNSLSNFLANYSLYLYIKLFFSGLKAITNERSKYVFLSDKTWTKQILSRFSDFMHYKGYADDRKLSYLIPYYNFCFHSIHYHATGCISSGE